MIAEKKKHEYCNMHVQQAMCAEKFGGKLLALIIVSLVEAA